MKHDVSNMTQHHEFVEDIMSRFAESTYWSDDHVSSLTVLIADALGDIGVSNSYANRFAAREAFVQLARRSSSVYAAMRTLGVPITRRNPATVRVKMTNNTPHAISMSKYDVFDVEGRPALLASPCIIAVSETVELDLIVGIKFSQSISLGQVPDYASLDLDTTDFNLAADLEVYTEDVAGNRVQFHHHHDALFSIQTGEKAFIDLTNDSGGVTIQFGGASWGAKPQPNTTLHVTGIQSIGAGANSEGVGFKVTARDYLRLQGSTITTISGGSDNKPLEYYKLFGPTLGSAKRKFISKDEWRAGIILYPDVADVVIQSQRDIAPNDKQWMGVIRVCVLPTSTSSWGGLNPNPESAQWSKFGNWLSRFHGILEVQNWNPTKMPIDLNLEVALFSDSSGSKAQYESIIRAAVYKLFDRKPGTLGKRLAISDITEAIKFDEKDVRRKYIDYVNVLSPMKDVIPNSVLEYVALRNLRITIKYSERT